MIYNEKGGLHDIYVECLKLTIDTAQPFTLYNHLHLRIYMYHPHEQLFVEWETHSHV